MNRRSFLGMLASLVPAAWVVKFSGQGAPEALRVTDVINGQPPTPIRFVAEEGGRTGESILVRVL